MAAMYGFVNTASWSADARPKSWKEGYLKWYPRGDAKITAMTAKTGKKGAITDPEHKWAVKDYPLRTGTIEGIYTDPAMGTPYVSGGVAGATLYLKVEAAHAAVARDMRIRAKIRVETTAYPRLYAILMVQNVQLVGTDYRVTAMLMEADDNGAVYAPQKYIAECNMVTVLGDMNAEFSPRPDSVQYEPEWLVNWTNIWRTSLQLSGTAEATKIRYGSSAYKMLQMDTFELHMREIEMDALFSSVYNGTDVSTRQPLRSVQGCIPWVEANVPANVYDFKVDHPGETWEEAGYNWLLGKTELVFKFGSTERVTLCGSGAVNGLNKLALQYGTINLTANDKLFGLDIHDWKSPHGTLGFMSHPLFNIHNVYTNALLAFNAGNIGFRPIQGRDTKFLKSPSSKKGEQGEMGYDGRLEEYRTEGTFEWGIPEEWHLFLNVGQDG